MADENGLVQGVESKIHDIRTTSLDLSFNEILDMYKDKELVIQPDYQRGFRWTREQQSRFIESILLEMPLPPIFLIEDKDNVYELIDGLQRISSYLNFRGALKSPTELTESESVEEGEEEIEETDEEDNEEELIAGPLCLSGCDILKEINGKTYEDLPASLKIKLKRNFIRALILKKETNPSLRYHMFKRLNTGGAILSEQEIRNCTIRLLSNDFIDFINRMAKNQDFRQCMHVVNKKDKAKMFYEECVLKFFALKNNIDNYKIGMKEFLTIFAESISNGESTFDYEQEELIFTSTFKLLNNINKEEIFATIDKRQQGIMKKFASYQFEAFTLGIQSLIDQIDPSDEALIGRLKELTHEIKLDADFQAITSGNYLHKKQNVIARANFVNEKFNAAL